VTRTTLRAGYEKVYSFFHPEIDDAVTTLVDKISDEPTDLTFGRWLAPLSVCMICAPEVTAKEIAALGPTITTAIQAVTKSHTGKMARMEMAAASIANLLDCGGVAISTRTFDEGRPGFRASSRSVMTSTRRPTGTRDSPPWRSVTRPRISSTATNRSSSTRAPRTSTTFAASSRS